MHLTGRPLPTSPSDCTGITPLITTNAHYHGPGDMLIDPYFSLKEVRAKVITRAHTKLWPCALVQPR